MTQERWIGLALIFSLTAVGSPPPLMQSRGDSSGGGVPPAPQFGERAKTNHGRYAVELTPMGQFGQLSVVDGLGGPAGSHITVKRISPNSRSTLWAEKTATSKKDARLLLSSLGAKLIVLRWDATLFSPLVSIACECASKELASGAWHLYLDYTFADKTTRRRMAGDFLDEESCEKFFPKAFPQCNQDVEKEEDFKRVKRALKAAPPAPSYSEVSSCRGTLKGANGYEEKARVRIVENDADPTDTRAVWVGTRFPALNCHTGTIDNWNLKCDDRNRPKPVGFSIRLGLKRELATGQPLAALTEYRDLVGRYLSGDLVCSSREAVTELKFAMEPFQRSGFLRGVPKWIPTPASQLTLSYFRRGDLRNQVRRLVYTDKSTQLDTGGDVAELRFANGARFPLPLTNTVRGVLLDLPWGQRIGFEELDGVVQDGKGLKVRYYDQAKNAWIFRTIP